MGDTLHDLTGKRFGHWTVLSRAQNRNEPSCGFAAVIVEMSLKSTGQA